MKKNPNIFDWSRNPSREGIHSVYISSPSTYASYNRDITREEMANALATWNKINDLKAKKAMFKTLFIVTLASIPFISIIYNMVSTILQNSK